MKVFFAVVIFVLGCEAKIFGIQKTNEMLNMNPYPVASTAAAGATTSTYPWYTSIQTWPSPSTTGYPWGTTPGNSRTIPRPTTGYPWYTSTQNWWTASTTGYPWGTTPWNWGTPSTTGYPWGGSTQNWGTTEVPPAECPYGSLTSFDGKTCFHLVKANKTFIEAEGACNRLGGHLASFHNAFDNMLVNGKLTWWNSMMNY